MSPTSRSVVALAADAGRYEASNQVLHLVERLVERGYSVEVVLLGENDHIEAMSRLAKITLVGHGAGRRLRQALGLFRFGAVDDGYASSALRRHLRRLAAQPWIICDRGASGFLTATDLRPPAVAAHFGDPGIRVDSVATMDRRLASDVRLWLTMTIGQADQIRAAGATAPVHPVGSLWLPDTPLPPSLGGENTVVLSTPSGAWESVSHAIEVVAQLRRRAPAVPLVWVTDAGEDEWLARHDLAHLALPAGDVSVLCRGESPLPRPKLIVRTGYQASDPDLVVAAAFTHVPTIGFELGDLPRTATTAVSPFAVEELVDLAVQLLDDRTREVVGASFASAVRDRPDPHERLGPLYEMLGATEAPSRAGGRWRAQTRSENP